MLSVLSDRTLKACMYCKHLAMAGGGGGGTVECDMLQGRGVNACDNLPKESQ